MHIVLIDNRRLRRARARLDAQIKGPFGTYEWRLAALVKFTHLLDQQSARIARRCQMPHHCGVPASAVLSPFRPPYLRWVTTRSSRGYHLPLILPLDSRR